MKTTAIDLHSRQELTEQLEWLRRLPRSLVPDPDVADDITNDHLLAAIAHRRGPRDPPPRRLATSMSGRSPLRFPRVQLRPSRTSRSRFSLGCRTTVTAPLRQ